MAIVLSNESQGLIVTLPERIETIERTLEDDQYFCHRDIEGIYQAALAYFQSIDEQLKKKFDQFQSELDRLRQENIDFSQKNKQIFGKQIEEIDQLFSSGKQNEALDKFYQYEKEFEKRQILLPYLPQLRVEKFDISQYFGLDYQPKTSSKEINKIEKATQTEQESPLIKSPSQNRIRSDEPSPVLTENSSQSPESKAPSSASTTRTFRFSRRLDSIPAEEILCPTLSPQSPMTISSSVLRQQKQLPTKLARADTLSLTHICHYQHDRNQSLLLAANADYLVVCKNQLQRFERCSLTVIERSNRRELNLPWQEDSIISIGFLNPTQFYFFTRDQYHVYSLELLSKIQTSPLFIEADESKVSSYQPYCSTATVSAHRAFYLHLNQQYQWVLSIRDCERWILIVHYKLNEILPEVQRFISIAIIDETIQFLVELAGSQYAMQICSSTMNPLRSIRLSYAEKPSNLCSVYFEKFQQYVFFIPDPSVKIIHLLTQEKYLKSHPLFIYALCYVEEKHELIVASFNDLCSIDLQTHEGFFSKYLC